MLFTKIKEGIKLGYSYYTGILSYFILYGKNVLQNMVFFLFNTISYSSEFSVYVKYFKITIKFITLIASLNSVIILYKITEQ